MYENAHWVPLRGEVWLANLNPTQGHEQNGIRPVLVISDNRLNQGPSGLVFVLPISKHQRPIPAHLAVAPPEGGLDLPSSILCDAIRSIDKSRLTKRLGVVSDPILDRVGVVLRSLLALE